MYIISHVNFPSNFFINKYPFMSGKFTSYFTSKFLLFKFDWFPILVLPLWFLQHCHGFSLDKCLFNWIIHVNKCSIFTPVSPINYKFMGPYVIQPVPIQFHQIWPISFYYCMFLILFSNTTTLTFELIKLHLIFCIWNQVIDQFKCVGNSNWMVTILHYDDYIVNLVFDFHQWSCKTVAFSIWYMILTGRNS